MRILFKNINLAIALTSLRISPLLLIRIATIALIYAAALYLSVVYIQSIGSGIVNFSGLFCDVQGFHTGSISIEPLLEPTAITLSYPSSEGGWLAHHLLDHPLHCNGLVMSSLLPVKPRLTKVEKEAFSLSQELKDITIGLLLGDLYARKQKLGVNTCLAFRQGILHEDYLIHLYQKFQDFCPQGPKIQVPKPDIRNGKVHKSIYFSTYSLPSFNELHKLFYFDGKKVIPLNIAELLTPLGLCYWICDDGCFDKNKKFVLLCTESFTMVEVELLIAALNSKWDLKCYKVKRDSSYRIIIPSYSISSLQSLLAPIMPSMMKHKIGL
jgi:hypothetical protein